MLDRLNRLTDPNNALNWDQTTRSGLCTKNSLFSVNQPRIDWEWTRMAEKTYNFQLWQDCTVQFFLKTCLTVVLYC